MTELFGIEHNKRRERMLENASRINYAQDAKQELQERNAALTPFPSIPTELVGIIRVIVPPKDDDLDGHSGQRRETSVFLTQELLEQINDTSLQVTPHLGSVDLTQFESDEDNTRLRAYHRYAKEYLYYLKVQHAWRKATETSLRCRYRFLKRELTPLWEGVTGPGGKALTVKIKDAYMGNDPALIECQRLAEVAKVVSEFLSLQIEAVREVVELSDVWLRRSYAGTQNSDMSPDMRALLEHVRGLRKG